MNNYIDMKVRVPVELYHDLVDITRYSQTDMNTALVHLFECYVDAGRKMLKDPAAKALLVK